MKRYLLDTNIILDIALKRKIHFADSSKIFELIDKNQIIGCVTASTITDIYYISKKEQGHRTAIEFISNLVEIVDILGVDKNIILRALQSDLRDFEDAVQSLAAKYNEIKTIITRNKADFLNTDVEILSPEELLEKLK